MRTWDSGPSQFVFPKPGKVLRAVLLTVFLVWLMFAVAINWGGASRSLFTLFCGNTEAILGGQVWRLVTAALMHQPQGNIGHVLWVLVGLYFLTPSLEERFGGPRLVRFLIGSAAIAYGFQFLMLLILPASIAGRLVAGEYWFGGFPVIEAVAVAWALNFKGQQVRLMFIIPASAATLLWLVIGFSVLRVIALSQAPEGLISPFGGLLAGWLLGGGTPSPLRRLYLKWKLAGLERDTRRTRSERLQKSNLKVVPGGRRDAGKKDQRGPNGDWLN